MFSLVHRNWLEEGSGTKEISTGQVDEYCKTKWNDDSDVGKFSCEVAEKSVLYRESFGALPLYLFSVYR